MGETAGALDGPGGGGFAVSASPPISLPRRSFRLTTDVLSVVRPVVISISIATGGLEGETAPPTSARRTREICAKPKSFFLGGGGVRGVTDVDSINQYDNRLALQINVLICTK